ETPTVTFYLWSPWRCSALEHKLFESIRQVAGAAAETVGDEMRVHIDDPKGWKAAVQNLARVLKGWQEEGSDVGKEERRAWRWLLEADVDGAGYDMAGERASFWCYVRLSVDRGGPGESEKGEDIDLNGFGVQIWGQRD
ncbi:MAG TPA: hypothetical protein VLM40_08010, partial [Gemmata sp.]|nr:hypothetical protein [Gemmata sp.]